MLGALLWTVAQHMVCYNSLKDQTADVEIIKIISDVHLTVSGTVTLLVDSTG